MGKTSLIKRLIFDRYEAGEVKTEGIAIVSWAIEDSLQVVEAGRIDPANRAAPIQFNIWDFGGQEIMHATHQFFLTKRSLYLLVLDCRLTQEENRVEYWLKIIQSFGGD